MISVSVYIDKRIGSIIKAPYGHFTRATSDGAR